jgi:PAS domain S-box-containing protein
MPSKEVLKKPQWYRELFQAAPLPIIATDRNGTVHEVNKAAAALLQVSAEQLMGKPLAKFFSQADRRTFSEMLRDAREAGTREFERREVTLTRAGRPRRAVALNMTEISEEAGAAGWLCWALVDLTEIKQAEEGLRQAAVAMRVFKEELTHTALTAEDRAADVIVARGRATELDLQLSAATADLARAVAERKEAAEQYRLLAARVQTMAEEQSTRIAREVHDELGQMITGIKMDVAWLSKRAPSELREKLSSMSAILDAAVDSVRRIALELRPALLDELGLSAAIEWLLEQYRERTGISCRLTASLDDSLLSHAESTALFRIFQEALTNVSRHAEATSVEVMLFEEGGIAVLKVQDNGRGIREALKSEHGSLGVLGMRERARLVGGEVDLESREGHGVVVTARVPLRSEGL